SSRTMALSSFLSLSVGFMNGFSVILGGSCLGCSGLHRCKRRLVTSRDVRRVLPQNVSLVKGRPVQMTQLAKDVASSVREETDFDLLTTIGCADIDQGQAERAFETLYNRYVGLLKGMALSAGWDRYG